MNIMSADGGRSDGRLANQLRPLAVEPGALSRADGSARFSHDGTEVLAAVYGPCEVRRTRESIDGATLEVIARPRAGIPSPADRELEQLIAQTLQHLILLSAYPRTAISVVVQVLSDDGALLSTALHAACAALMHAGVPLRGMLGGCTLTLKSDGSLQLDPVASEEAEAEAVVSLCFLLRQGLGGALERKLVLSHVRGTLSRTQYDTCECAATEAAACVGGFLRQSLRRDVTSLTAAGTATSSGARITP